MEGRAPRLHDPANRPAATGLWTGLALAVIDGELVLEIAQTAIGLAVVAQRGTAGLDRPGDDLADVVSQWCQML